MQDNWVKISNLLIINKRITERKRIIATSYIVQKSYKIIKTIPKLRLLIITDKMF